VLGERLVDLGEADGGVASSSRPITPTMTPPTGSMLLFSREMVSMEKKK
jgi:hypothetical protein